MIRSEPRAILFDYGGTLDSDGIPWKERFYPFYQQVGIDWDFVSFERFFYASDDSLTEEMLGEVGYQAMLFEHVCRVLRNGERYDARHACRISRDFYSDSLYYLQRNKTLLQRLSQHYRLGIVSNFYGNLEFLCREIGYGEVFSVIIDSARIGFAKPHALIFRTALERLDCLPEKTVFVGDNPVRDMAGARAVSMPHIWLNANSDQKPCCEGDPVIRSLVELEGILL
jgi:FMN phosphatase YigB (HAD superfamily)